MRKNLDNGLLHAMSALVRVVDAGSFTAAGAQMHLTTAQISRLVSELENRLQSKLLHRTTRKLALTSVGEQYVKDARTILDLVAQAENNVAGISTQPAGRLRVMCMTSFGNRYVVPLVPKFCARFPRVNLEYSASQYVPDLLGGGVDVSVYLSQHLPDSGTIAQRLGVTSAVLCAAPKYLAAQGVPKMPRELAGHACLRLLNPSISSNWELSDGKTLEILSPIGPVLGDIPEVVLQGALGGLGIALLPRYNVVDALKRGTLVRVLPRWQSPEIGVFLLTPSRHFVDVKTREWVELLKQEIPAALARDAEYFEDAQPKARSRIKA
ncbi:LysR family transcriptional regulator [Burkholderia gladioli]|uniref:LysR family transcriptional regulator n=1 Tax=Burkholderia gladioli TaxID=28095 RepID=UPI001641C293|nr:LysR family transcriptional regulator [Burkholderia gladioli]